MPVDFEPPSVNSHMNIEKFVSKLAKEQSKFALKNANYRRRLFVEKLKFDKFFQKHQFFVRTLENGMPHSELASSIVLTNNTEKFFDGAPIHEYSLISYEKLGKVSDETLLNMVLDVFMEYSLNSRPHSWVLMLKLNGKHMIGEIP